MPNSHRVSSAGSNLDYAAGQAQHHLIRHGETLSGIAAHYGLTVNDVMAANRHIRDPNLIYAGQSLVIPHARENATEPNAATHVYTVKSGDTMSAIAARGGIDLGRLVKANAQVKNPDLIYPGEHLNVPETNGRRTSPPAPTHANQPTRAGNQNAIGKLPRTGDAFIDSIAAAAIRSQRQTGVPASVTIAQALLESDRGRSGLTREANNYFGIKGEGPAGHVIFPTQEYVGGQIVTVNAAFRRYHNAAESFTDHGRFFRENSRYSEALKHTNDAHRFAREIQRAGYATDPSYSDKLISIIDRYDLTRFDRIARSHSSSPQPAGSTNGGGNRTRAATYTVQPGDTLSGIAQRFHTTVAALAKLNHISDPNFIRAGQQLKLSGASNDNRNAAPVGGSNPNASALGKRIMDRAKVVGDEINRTGGYRFDGTNDCYGFMRRVWNPILESMGKPPLPVSDYPSSQWQRIDWDRLKPGDVLSTAQGHAWGADWHGGIFAGKINGVLYIYDNSGSKSAQLRPLPNPNFFRYYYTPTHKTL